ncbi:MAG: hypothetical protein L0Z55_07925 [Planctomycetes bacterium]|nr:hypothetical protein [Planctomycetota bacterium]
MDSELEATTTYEIVQHLENCHACREIVAAEERLERSIVGAMRRAEPGDDEIWKRVVTAGVGRRRRPRVQILVAASVFAAACVFLVFWAAPRQDLISCLRRDFELVETGRSALDVVASEPQALERFFAERMGKAVRVAPIDEFQLHGARVCSLRGAPTAFILYRKDGMRASVAIFDAEKLAGFAGADRDRTLWRDDAGKVHVVAVRSGGKIIGVAGSAPIDELEKLCNAFRE